MALKEILSISGHSSLFKHLSQARNGIIVESLADGKRTHISASAKVSALSDISIYTDEGEVSLGDVLDKIKSQEDGQQTISQKSTNEELKSFFAKVLPNYDADRVYVSDIKKVVAWYNQLQSLNIMDFTDPDDQQENESNDGEQKSDAPKSTKTDAVKKDTKKAPSGSKSQAGAKGKASSKPQSTRKVQTPRKGE